MARFNQPLGGNDMPRFGGPATMMRLPAQATAEGLDTSESTVTASVSLGRTDSGVGLAVTLEARIPGVDEAKAQELVEKAHRVCPYSKATRGNIDVTLTGVPV